MERSTEDSGMRIWVSPDGKSAVARMNLGASTGMKIGGGGEKQPYDEHGLYLGTLHAANDRTGNDRTGNDRTGKHSGNAGSATPKSPLGVGQRRGETVGKYYVLPPAVKSENERIALVYSQTEGTLMDMEDRLVGQGYSGAQGYDNKPESEGMKDKGVIPRGTWTVGPVIEDPKDTRGKGENLIKLVPDQATADRVRAMGRDPDTFYIHAGKRDINDRTASQGCIIMKKNERMVLRQLQGAKIRVVR